MAGPWPHNSAWGPPSSPLLPPPFHTTQSLPCGFCWVHIVIAAWWGSRLHQHVTSFYSWFPLPSNSFIVGSDLTFQFVQSLCYPWITIIICQYTHMRWAEYLFGLKQLGDCVCWHFIPPTPLKPSTPPPLTDFLRPRIIRKSCYFCCCPFKTTDVQKPSRDVLAGCSNL